MKNSFAEFCELCDRYYCKMIKLCRVPGWACQHAFLERAAKLPSLKNFCQTPDIKKGEELKTRISRLSRCISRWDNHLKVTWKFLLNMLSLSPQSLLHASRWKMLPKQAIWKGTKSLKKKLKNTLQNSTKKWLMKHLHHWLSCKNLEVRQKFSSNTNT